MGVGSGVRVAVGRIGVGVAGGVGDGVGVMTLTSGVMVVVETGISAGADIHAIVRTNRMTAATILVIGNPLADAEIGLLATVRPFSDAVPRKEARECLPAIREITSAPDLGRVANGLWRGDSITPATTGKYLVKFKST